jgi:hypothetical protein
VLRVQPQVGRPVELANVVVWDVASSAAVDLVPRLTSVQMLQLLPLLCVLILCVLSVC